MNKSYKNVETVKPSGLELQDHLVGVQRVTKEQKVVEHLAFQQLLLLVMETEL